MFFYLPALPGGRERLAPVLAANPDVIHPVLRTHSENGRTSLFVNCLFTTHIIGLPSDESDDLLNSLYAHMEKDEFRCAFEWRPGSVAFWVSLCALSDLCGGLTI